MRYVCKSCGANQEIDETTAVCRHCNAPISPDGDASGSYVRALKQRAEKERCLGSVLASYDKSSDPQELYRVVSSYDEYMQLFDIDKIWRAFVISAAGAAVRKGDSALQLFLKNHAKEYDSKREHSSLFRAILLSYPKFGTNNDWDDLIHATAGNRDEFSVISDSIIGYIAKEKDKAFAIDIFTLIDAKGDEWSDIGRYYIRAFLSNEEIADKVFHVSAFDRSARKFASRLMAYCKRYLDGENGIAVEETRVWASYTAAMRKVKKRTLIFSAAATVLLLGILLSVVLTLNSIKRDSIAFSVDKVIEVQYGDALDLSDYTLSYTKRSGKEIVKTLSDDLLFGYDPAAVGVQQNAYFEFRGVRVDVLIIVGTTALEAPVLTQVGNRVVWDTVPNAKSYAVYVNATAIETLTTADRSCDLSTLPLDGVLTVTVRAVTDDVKYESSPMSAPLTLTKLAAPTGIAYAGGKLTWDSVPGATGYELSVGSDSYVTSKPDCELSLVRGDNDITITAVSADTSIIHGVTKKSLYYNKLSPITAMTYQNGTVSFAADADATIFSVYVDGTHWKDLSRSYFSVTTDGFADAFGLGRHTVEVVCRTSLAGIEASERRGYTVVFGGSASVSDGILSWPSIGEGATYSVTINGTLHTLHLPTLALSEYAWPEGETPITVTARLDGTDYILEGVTLKKHARPRLSVSEDDILAEDGLLFCLNGGEWSALPPAISELSEGTHKLLAKRPASSPLEIESDTAELTLMRPAAPVLRVTGGALVCSYDSTLFKLALSYYDNAAERWIEISSLSDIAYAGTYRLRAQLLPLSGADGTTLFLPSPPSAELTVEKPEAPTVSYDRATGLLSSTTVGVTFYYEDEKGVEHEIAGGRASALPGGVFSVYARLNATGDNTLNSENTPENLRVSVFNLDVEFTLSRVSGSQNQCYFVFRGCDDIDSLTFSYRIDYFNDAGEKIGVLDKTGTTVTGEKQNSTTIAVLVNYRVEADLDVGYSHADVKKIEVTVLIGDAPAQQQKTAALIVR